MKKEDVGELFLYILEYQNGLNPIRENAIIDIVFEPFETDILRIILSIKLSKQKFKISISINTSTAVLTYYSTLLDFHIPQNRFLNLLNFRI
jgi:hypothetical protein